MNREQRRAMLKNVNKKFTGFDLTDGTLKIPVKVNGEQKDELQLNLNDYNTFSALYNMYLMFTNIEENYKELFDEADNAPTQMDKVKKTMKAYQTIINNFTNYIDDLFGDGASFKIFGVKTPMPSALVDFLDGLQPVLELASQIIGEELPTQNVTPINKYTTQE